jgi:hypothetical protein
LEKEASIPPNVPWDPTELQGRDCAHCACYFESANPENPAQFQGFCRRWPAEFSQTRGQVPRLDPVTKLPVMKNGVPVMNNELIMGYLYKPTQRQGICFDGYRPKGSLPGETRIDEKLKEFLLKLVEGSHNLFPQEVLGDLRQLLTGSRTKPQ